MSRTLFITGTDTEVGKTYVSKLLLEHFNQQGLKTIGLKPIASNACFYDGQLRNQDAMTLQATASVKLSYELVNPWCFEPAIAPHIAAKQANVSLSVKDISEHINNIKTQYKHDICLVEGAGGWYVPLNEKEYFSDLVIQNQWEVILVSGIRLGCINHTLLTAEAIQHSKVPFAGWISNCLSPHSEVQQQNIETLRQSLSTPHLFHVSFGTANCSSTIYRCN